MHFMKPLTREKTDWFPQIANAIIIICFRLYFNIYFKFGHPLIKRRNTPNNVNVYYYWVREGKDKTYIFNKQKKV